MKWRVGIAIVAAMFLLVGCGQKASEKAAEGLVNSLLGGAGIQIEDGGGSISFTGDDGSTVNLSAAAEGTVPANFPLPVFPGMKTDGFVETKSDGKLGWIGSLYFDGDREKIATEYEAALKKLGLEPNMWAITDEDGFSALLSPSGSIGGKHYGGMLTFSANDDGGGLGQNVLSVMFGEQDPDDD